MKPGMVDVSGTKLSTRKLNYGSALRQLVPMLRELGYCWISVCTMCVCSLNKIYRHSKSQGCALIDD
jgi:hypothetical protein